MHVLPEPNGTQRSTTCVELLSSDGAGGRGHFFENIPHHRHASINASPIMTDTKNRREKEAKRVSLADAVHFAVEKRLTNSLQFVLYA